MMQPMAPHATRLSALLQGVLVLPETLDRVVSGIELDSRKIAPGAVFLACKGASFDGRRFIGDAIRQGASAVLVEADAEWRDCSEQQKVPVVPVIGLPAKMHKLASRFYGEPANKLRLLGITGTNGKTTCCLLLGQLLNKLGCRCGVIGTLGYGMASETLEIDNSGPGTTPDAVRLQGILAQLHENGASTVVMEVSSHGIQQARVDMDAFTLALFTNLTRDHLDFHSDLDDYGSTKRRLFHGRKLQIAILNLDDDYSAGTRAELDSSVSCLTWSLENTAADVYAKELLFAPNGIHLLVVTPWGEYRVHSPLLGSFNASNLLAVLCAALACQSDQADFLPEKIVTALQTLTAVNGRMQLVGATPVAVVVDYAHTPDGLEKALQAVHEHRSGKVICVFGCGGDRDKGKRPLMGAMAERLSDVMILTDDNPRNESAGQIIADILEGIENKNRVQVFPDRSAAISAAINQANAGDVVLVAGKGHETYQEYAGKRLPFNDVKQAQNALSQRFGAVKGVADKEGVSGD